MGSTKSGNSTGGGGGVVVSGCWLDDDDEDENNKLWLFSDDDLAAAPGCDDEIRFGSRKRITVSNGWTLEMVDDVGYISSFWVL